jgi:2'-5' RNA ligase
MKVGGAMPIEARCPRSIRIGPMPAAAHRLFLALWPETDALDAIAAWQSAFGWPHRARPIPREKLHVTLHFLGDVAASHLPGLAAMAALPFEAFELEFAVPAVWSGGIAVLEPVAEAAALADLRQRLGEALQAGGLPVDPRPYRPHVTLARQAEGAATPASPRPPVRWRVERCALVESRAGRYTALGPPP